MAWYDGEGFSPAEIGVIKSLKLQLYTPPQRGRKESGMSKEVGLLEVKQEKQGANGAYVSLKVNGKFYNVFQPLVAKAQALRLNEKVEITWKEGKNPKWPDVTDVCVQTGDAVSTPPPDPGSQSAPPETDKFKKRPMPIEERVSIVYQTATKAAVEIATAVIPNESFAWLEENHERVCHLTAKMAQAIFTDIWASSKAVIEEMS